MTAATARRPGCPHRSGERRLVPHRAGLRTERHQEEVQLAQVRVGKSIRALRKDRGGRSLEDERELQTLLAVGPEATGLSALSRLRKLDRQDLPIAELHLERFADPVAEQVMGEPVESRHPPMLSPATFQQWSPS